VGFEPTISVLERAKIVRALDRALDEMKLRIVAAIETVTQQMLENTWRENEYRLAISRATRDAHVEFA
jgi:hypothetical protein